MTKGRRAAALLVVGLSCCGKSSTPSSAAHLFDVDQRIQPHLSEMERIVGQGIRRRSGVTITVAPSANDSAAIDRALAWARAQRVQSSGAVTILFRPGIYRLSRPLRVTAADSGTPGAPLRLQGDPSGPVILTGTVALARAPLPERLVRLIPSCLHDRVQGFVVPEGIVPQPAFPSRASQPEVEHPTLIVTQGSQQLHRSVWPRRGYERQAIARPQQGPTVAPIVSLSADLSARLVGEPALSAGGYWTFDWFYEERPIAGPAERQLRVGALTSYYPEAKSIRFRLLNGFGLLATPGDMAYFDGHLAAVAYGVDAPVEAARLNTIVAVNGAHDVVLEGLGVRGARGTAVTIERAHDILFADGYIGLTGGGGVTASDSARVVVYRSVVADIGGTGVALRGSEDAAPTRNAVIDSIITTTGNLNRAYAPAIRLTGAGQVVSGNLLTDLPHAAIIFNGRNHSIVGNEITRTNLETADAGAVYSFGSLTTRGTIIAYNYFHDIAKAPGLEDTTANQVRTVYLDSWTSGETIAGNVFLRSAWPFWINGGENNRVEGNVFVDANYSGRLYDISQHWRGGLGEQIRGSIAQVDAHSVQALGIRPDSSLLTTGRGSGNIVADNMAIRSGNTLVDSRLANLQLVEPERILPSPRGRVDLGQALTLARNAGLNLRRVRSRADGLRSLRYAAIAMAPRDR